MARTLSSGRQRVQDAQPGFQGGLNVSVDEAKLAPTEIRRADNAELTEEGAVTRRGGSQRLSAAVLAASPVRGGFAWRKADGSVEEMAVAGGVLYTGTYAIPMTWTAETGALASGVTPSFAAFRDGTGECVYIADGGALNKWDGTALTINIANTPNCASIWVYNSRLYGCGDPAKPQTLFASAINNGDSLGYAPSGGVEAIIRTFGDQRLTTGVAVGGSNLLFHTSGISRFTGLTLDDIAIAAGTRGVTQDVGTIAPGSVVPLDNAVLFLSDRGVYAATESGVQPVAGPIESAITTFSRTDFGRVAAVHHRAKRQVLFYLPDVGIYAYHYRVQREDGAGAWTGPWAGGLVSPVTHSLWESQDSSGRPIVLRGDASGWVTRLDAPAVRMDNVASDGTGGATYSLAVRLHRLVFGDGAGEKSLRSVWVTADLRGSTKAAIQWVCGATRGTARISDAASGTTSTWGAPDSEWGEAGSVWGGGGQGLYEVKVYGRGPWCDVTIVDDGAAATLVSHVEVEAHHMGRRNR